jgi:hypothetical protein
MRGQSPRQPTQRLPSNSLSDTHTEARPLPIFFPSIVKVSFVFGRTLGNTITSGLIGKKGRISLG